MAETKTETAATGSFWDANDFVTKESLLDSGERFYVLDVEQGISTSVGTKYRVTVRNERGTVGELMFGADVKSRAAVLDKMREWLRSHKDSEIAARLSASGDKVSLIPA